MFLEFPLKSALKSDLKKKRSGPEKLWTEWSPYEYGPERTLIYAWSTKFCFERKREHGVGIDGHFTRAIHHVKKKKSLPEKIKK